MSNLYKLIKLSRRGKKLTCITAYDASFAKYLDNSDIDKILVGDSLGWELLIVADPLCQT